MIKGIFFDFWGTLVENGIYSPVKQVKAILRIRKPFPEYIVRFERAFMTKNFDNLREAFENVIKEFNLNPPNFVVDKLIGMWNKNTLLSKPFPETIDVLKELKSKGLKLVIISNTEPFSINQVLDKHNLRDFFDAIILSYEYGMLKLDPELFNEALNKVSLSREEVIMIGDSLETDIKGAERAGIKAYLIDRKDKREFKNKIKSLKDIENIISI